MGNSNPRDAIIAYLSAPSSVISSNPGPNTQGWQMQQNSGGFAARPETFRFLKVRALAHRQLHFVTFRDAQDFERSMTCYVVEDGNGIWQLQGASGGGSAHTMQSPTPLVSLGGGGWPSAFYAGGYVYSNDLDIVRVRLVGNNNVVLEDSVEHGIVLFLSEQLVEVPIQALLYDRHGTVVAQHSVFSKINSGRLQSLIEAIENERKQHP